MSTLNQLCKELSSIYGSRGYRITNDGEVHVRRQSNERCGDTYYWAFYGYVETLLAA
jgi:hypothetical protein